MNNPSNKWSILYVTSFAHFLVPFMLMAINVALPSIGREFAMDAVMLGWLSVAPVMASAMLVVPAGRISDIYGRKKIFWYGIILCTVTSLLLAFSNSAASLITWRVGQGFGAAMIIASGVAIISSVFPGNERGKALGISVASVYAGQSFAPFLGGVLTQHFGWRSIFIVTVPVGLIAIIFVAWKLKDEWAEARGEKFDLFGSLLYALMLFLILYGLSSLPGIRGVWATLLGVLGLLVFIKWEASIEEPILELNLFKRSRTFTLSNLAAFINYSAVHSVAFLLSLYLQYVKGYTPQSAGLVLVAQPIIQAVFSPLAGWLADRTQPRVVASAGMALTAIGLLIFALISDETSLPIIISGLVLVGFGLAIFVSPNTKAIMGSVEKRYYGVASATMATSRQIGMMFSMAITMLIFSLFIGGVEVTPEYIGPFLKSVRTIFMIFVVLCILGMFASLARGKMDEGN